MEIDFKELKIDGLLVSGLPNIRYLAGFTGDNALLLLTPDSKTLFTDPRYTIQARGECSCPFKTVRGPLAPEAAKLIARKKLKRIGFEKARLTYDGYAQLKEALPLGATLRPVAGVIERLRMVKTEDEIHKIRRSVFTNSAAFSNTVRKIRAGMTESEIAAELEYQMRRRGAEKPAFDTIVATAARSALPHAQPTSRAIGVNELILIDMGAFQEGYASDMTRMLFLGSPDRRVQTMYKAVLEAQLAAIDAVRPGATAGAVDQAARKTLRKAGLDKAFVHSTGHGLGLEIHEPPRLGKKQPEQLEAGMVVTIEPGAYIEGFGGIRIEDTVLVTSTGCEVLTPTPKELMVL